MWVPSQHIGETRGHQKRERRGKRETREKKKINIKKEGEGRLGGRVPMLEEMEPIAEREAPSSQR